MVAVAAAVVVEIVLVKLIGFVVWIADGSCGGQGWIVRQRWREARRGRGTLRTASSTPTKQRSVDDGLIEAGQVGDGLALDALEVHVTRLVLLLLPGHSQEGTLYIVVDGYRQRKRIQS